VTGFLFYEFNSSFVDLNHCLIYSFFLQSGGWPLVHVRMPVAGFHYVNNPCLNEIRLTRYDLWPCAVRQIWLRASISIHRTAAALCHDCCVMINQSSSITSSFTDFGTVQKMCNSCSRTKASGRFAFIW
jgi:hypothetical protein